MFRSAVTELEAVRAKETLGYLLPSANTPELLCGVAVAINSTTDRLSSLLEQ